MGLPWWCSGTASACQDRRHGFDPWVRRSSGEGNGNPPKYACLGNPMVREAWWATVHKVAKEADMTWQRNHHQQRVWASLVAQMVKNLPIMQETQVQSLGWKYLLEKG